MSTSPGHLDVKELSTSKNSRMGATQTRTILLRKFIAPMNKAPDMNFDTNDYKCLKFRGKFYAQCQFLSLDHCKGLGN